MLVDSAAGVFVPPHRRRIGYVFQEGRLFPHLTVRQNLLFGRWFAPPARAPRRTSTHVVELLGIGPLLGAGPARCPAARSSASRSGGRCSPAPACC